MPRWRRDDWWCLHLHRMSVAEQPVHRVGFIWESESEPELAHGARVVAAFAFAMARACLCYRIKIDTRLH